MMPSLPQLLIVLVVVLLLFGRNKIPQLMGDVAKGIKSFKKGMKDDDDSNNTDKDKDIENKSDNEK